MLNWSNFNSSFNCLVLLKYSLEFRLSLSDSPMMYVLMFMEAGNVWKDFQNLKLYAGDVKKTTKNDPAIAPTELKAVSRETAAAPPL